MPTAATVVTLLLLLTALLGGWALFDHLLEARRHGGRVQLHLWSGAAMVAGVAAMLGGFVPAPPRPGGGWAAALAAAALVSGAAIGIVARRWPTATGTGVWAHAGAAMLGFGAVLLWAFPR